MSELIKNLTTALIAITRAEEAKYAVTTAPEKKVSPFSSAVLGKLHYADRNTGNDAVRKLAEAFALHHGHTEKLAKDGGESSYAAPYYNQGVVIVLQDKSNRHPFPLNEPIIVTASKRGEALCLSDGLFLDASYNADTFPKHRFATDEEITTLVSKFSPDDHAIFSRNLTSFYFYAVLGRVGDAPTNADESED